MTLEGEVREAADRILNADEVTVISHIDADGITSLSVLMQAITRAGVMATPVFLRQLEPLMMHRVPKDDSLKVFSDLGAGQQNLLEEHGLAEDEVVIVDHHVSQEVDTPYLQVNALPYGHTKFSAAGAAYLVARAIDADNRDLAKLAVIGNVGDMMAREDCGLIGPAREIAGDGIEYGNVTARRDLNLFGISTRPLHICLAYSDETPVRGVTGNPQGARRFLELHGIRTRTDSGRWRVWEDLDDSERQTITSALTEQVVADGGDVEKLTAELYLFPDEAPQTALRNAAEFSTLLNACGRWARPEIGAAVCADDRGVALREAEHMLTHHRATIKELMHYILKTGVEELGAVQYIHVGDRFPDTVVGIGAGMALSKLNQDKPVLVMCSLPEDPSLTKVSMRATDRMVGAGLDLQAALIEAAAPFGGAGGGHAIAAGAYIPREAEEEFLGLVDACIGRQRTRGQA
ncbi:DHH family phosphoesterase [Methanofollis aquaemaris]|uniref:DHH family phosphoesterase n=1 Tax=Methanofollis aquaemaris TaxID=126734 RepID=A0A8A3S7B8_9EURY|nr:DHH family phosphoesterase [Methanofollis aquaemaris]QSZ67833.1 DHH family phosphoesterase [Methanofollis aquaemaris]